MWSASPDVDDVTIVGFTSIIGKVEEIYIPSKYSSRPLTYEAPDINEEAEEEESGHSDVGNPTKRGTLTYLKIENMQLFEPASAIELTGGGAASYSDQDSVAIQETAMEPDFGFV